MVCWAKKIFSAALWSKLPSSGSDDRDLDDIYLNRKMTPYIGLWIGQLLFRVGVWRVRYLRAWRLSVSKLMSSSNWTPSAPRPSSR